MTIGSGAIAELPHKIRSPTLNTAVDDRTRVIVTHGQTVFGRDRVRDHFRGRTIRDRFVAGCIDAGDFE